MRTSFLFPARTPSLFLLSILFLIPFSGLRSQAPASGDSLTGLYRTDLDSQQQWRIKKEGDQLILELVGQGQTKLIPLGNGRFRPEQVSPPAVIEFIKDSTGSVYKFTWSQDKHGQKTELVRVSLTEGGKPDGYSGQYKIKNNPYRTIRIREEGKGLTIQYDKSSPVNFSPLSADKFVTKNGGYTVVYEFIRDRQGNIQKLMTSESGLLDLIKVRDVSEMASATAATASASLNSFTRADTLQSMLTPLRTCYDVLFYGLDISVLPETKSITGTTTIRLRAVDSFDRMQVDLYANMKIEKILFHDRELPYTREYNAVFIRFPTRIAKGEEISITFSYSGQPQVPDAATLRGGFFWFQDRNGKPWIESVCQGSGASLWWPCKDHLSDKPDSMRISITVPTGLTDISNGRLLGTTELSGNRTRFDWYVGYPINNYNVVVNIGDYAHLSDTYATGENDTLALNYYCMSYNLEKARQIFRQVKPMLALYEKDFGPYPFQKDGFTLMESLYPMEHQGAVSFGPLTNPINSDHFDRAEIQRTAWHESAHEWWGNSITCKDMADLWIHESFATYAEVLAYDAFAGRPAAAKYLKEQHPENKEPIIGIYNVNHFHLGDMYSKGCLMLNTLRNAIDNDSCWFAMLRGLQQRFRYQSVTTEEIVGFINWTTKKDYTPFFDQYLRHTELPELSLIVKKIADGLEVQYKWNVPVSGFDLPVKVTTAKNIFSFIYPTTEWKTIRLGSMTPADLKVDTDDFYIRVALQ